MPTGVATYYDRLGYWNRVARIFGFGGGMSALTVHRALADPREHGRATFTRIHDLLVHELAASASPRVLDAGCGLGGTMIALAEGLDATCIGITLSAAQGAAANRAALGRGLAPRVRALVGSYDQPPGGPFDIVVAVESLAHSKNPDRSVAALVRVLGPGGCLVVVDDMPEPSAADARDLDTFKAGWQCPVLWSASDYVKALTRLGCNVDVVRDLTDDCRPRSRSRIAQLMLVNRLVYWIVPWTPLRQVMSSHLGGLALERLLRDRLVRYRLLVARKPELRVS